MKLPDPPFLELNFYFADLPETDAFSRLIKALVGMGAQFTGEGYAHRGMDMRDTPFAAITDEHFESISIAGSTDLEQCLADPNSRLLQVYMYDATGVVHANAEIVTYLSVSPEAALTDRHPLAIWTEGWLFSGPLAFRKQYMKRAEEVGRQIYQRFRSLVEILHPTYAAITCEWSLECLTDLRRDPRSYAFRDFFISRTYFGTPKLTRIQSLLSGAYIEPVGDGLYISGTKEMNPELRSLERRYAQEQSIEIAKLIASTSKTCY